MESAWHLSTVLAFIIPNSSIGILLGIDLLREFLINMIEGPLEEIAHIIGFPRALVDVSVDDLQFLDLKPQLVGVIS